MTDVNVYGQVDGLRQRVARLEQMLDAVVAATGVELPEELTTETASTADPAAEEVAAALRAGNRMGAVKLAAEKLGLSLTEATEYVGRVEASI